MKHMIRLLRIARWHAALLALVLLLPWWLLLRVWMESTALRPHLALDILALALIVCAAAIAAHRRDRAWLARRLDRLRPELEDSSALAWQPTPANAVARLQRERLHQRIGALPVRALQLHTPRRTLISGALLAASLFALVLWLPRPASDVHGTNVEPRASTAIDTAAPRLISQRLDIEPPAYTGLPAQQHNTLDARIVEGAQVQWQLQFDRAPDTAALRFLDGEELALHEHDGLWQASRVIDRAARYRLIVDGVPPDATAPASRLDVIRDLPPRISVTAPQQTLTLLDDAKSLQLGFEVSDDYGLAPAQLTLTLAQGDGELVEVSERTIQLRGDGEPTLQRYSHSIDLAALGFSVGDDLILRVSVADNRHPEAQTTRSPAYILRWPRPVAADSEGIEGVVQRTLPAYFRSQRQIIIDSEALLEEQPALDPDRFVVRSDAIGIDQRLLRLRYGQFLGEEAETGIVGASLPDGHSLDDGHDHDAHDHDRHDHDHGHDNADGEDDRQQRQPHDHDHDHAEPVPGDAASLIAQYGHMHDQAEAATLFDPVTRELLRSALREMWSSELHLRTGQPALALPYQYRALDYIKRVQQASRVYLARVGLELPPIDPGRRLTGDRSTLRPRPDPLPTATGSHLPAEALWQRLAELETEAPARFEPELAEFTAWLREHEGSAADPLALFEAIEALHLQPGCHDCAVHLRTLLWPLRPVPATGTRLRATPDGMGRAYLDAIAPESALPHD
jgi:hypothetical protein